MFYETLGRRRERAEKPFSKRLYGWDIIVWCTCLQLVVITPQQHAIISRYQMWTHVSLSFQEHFLFMFLNIGYHCDPNPHLLESVFNQMKGLYWGIFLVGKKNEPTEKWITAISLIIHLVSLLHFWRPCFGNVVLQRLLFIHKYHKYLLIVM